LVGAVAGGFLGARAARRQGEGFSPTWLAGGAILGVVAGLFVSLLDRPRAEGERSSEEKQAFEGGQAAGIQTQSSGSLIARFLAVLTVLLCWVPFVGLILGGVAWLLNRNVQGWPKTASRIGTFIAVLITVLLTILMVWNPSTL